MGSILERERGGRTQLRVYLTGDTLCGAYLRPIHDRYPDIDAMVIHLGGTRIAGVLLTMDDVQGVRATRLVDPRSVVPIHYDDYGVFTSPLDDYLRRMRTEAPELRVSVPARGAPVALEPRPSAA
jgi:L-ascorbate metabolism protein UlaG (beta-lactamase superfamily)